jgi:hypothetical protein
MQITTDINAMITMGELSARLMINRRTLSRWLAENAAEGLPPLPVTVIGNAKLVRWEDAVQFAANRGRLLRA